MLILRISSELIFERKLVPRFVQRIIKKTYTVKPKERFKGDDRGEVKAYYLKAGMYHFGRGCIYTLIPIFKKHKVPYKIEDFTYFKEIDYDFSNCTAIPKKDQAKALKQSIKARYGGCVLAATSVGKTLIALFYAVKLKCVVTVVVWSTIHQKQFIDEILKFNIIKKSDIGGCGGVFEEETKVGIINICMQQSLYNSKSKLAKFNAVSSCVAADELQKYAATTFTDVLDSFKARYRIGLSASIDRHDKLGFIIPWYVGAKVYGNSSTKSPSRINCVINLVLTKFKDSSYAWSKDYNTLLNKIANDKKRNTIIVDRAMQKAYKEDRVTLIFVQRKQHVINLLKMFPDDIDIGVIMSATGKSDLKKYNLNKAEKQYLVDYDPDKELDKVIKLAKDKKMRIIIGTDKVFVGFNEKILEHGIITTLTGENLELFNQQVGRIERSFYGDKYLLDKYGKKRIPTLDYMFDELMKEAKKKGLNIKKNYPRKCRFIRP